MLHFCCQAQNLLIKMSNHFATNTFRIKRFQTKTGLLKACKNAKITLIKASLSGVGIRKGGGVKTKVDYSGKTIGLLTVKGLKEHDGEMLWECECKCGNTVYLTSRQLHGNRPRSCGCRRSPNLVGKKFGRLKVVEKTDQRDSNYNVYYRCECKCGGERLVTAHNLNHGSVTSCGCLATEASKAAGHMAGQYIKDNFCIDGTNVKRLTAPLHSNNTSGHKGVYWRKSRQKWVAQIHFKGKHYHLGSYDDIKDAIMARKIAEDKMFGDFLLWFESREVNDKKEHGQ